MENFSMIPYAVGTALLALLALVFATSQAALATPAQPSLPQNVTQPSPSPTFAAKEASTSATTAIAPPMDFDFVIVGGYLDMDVRYYGDNAVAHPYSNLNHGLRISTFFPETILPHPFDLSLFIQGKYVTFSESIDRKMAAAKFVDIDYGFNTMLAVNDRLRIDLLLGISSNPTLIRRSPGAFKVHNYPTTRIGSKVNYTVPISSRWQVSLHVGQYILGNALVSGVKIKDGLGLAFGFQFNLDLDDFGYAFIGYQGSTEQQNTLQASVKRNEDLIQFGLNIELESSAVRGLD